MNDLEKKESEILEAYKISPEAVKSSRAWNNIYTTDDLLEMYLEKSGYEHDELEKKQDQILSAYTMEKNQVKSVKAWMSFYSANEVVDMYLDKSGY